MADEEKNPGKICRFFGEFKTFAIKGNMLDMAVGLIVGGAFTTLVNSIVTNIATPIIGALIGVDFSGWEIELPNLYGDKEVNVIEIGVFLNSIISFLVVAFVVFLFVKAINSFKKKQEEKPAMQAEPSKEEVLLAEIRDILKESSAKK